MAFAEHPDTQATVLCDYLVIGAGVQGLAFTDSLLQADKKAQVVIVDRNAQAGGVYNRTHAFMKLEMQGCYTGIDSLPLTSDAPNRDEMLVYFNRVIQKFKKTGRVKFFPSCSASVDGSRIVAALNPECSWRVVVKKKVVDGTFSQVKVPTLQNVPYTVDRGVQITTPAKLPEISNPHAQYIVIGAGRTGIDTLLWLLSQRIAPNTISWVVSRSAWYNARESTEKNNYVDGMLSFNEELAKMQDAANVDDIFFAMEKQNAICRVDSATVPEVFHHSSLSFSELEKLRQVRHICLGRVLRVRRNCLELEHGFFATSEDTLYVHCASSWIRDAPRPIPIYREQRITLQLLAELSATTHNFAWGAATIGYLEALYPEETATEYKNSLLLPAAPCDTPADYVRRCLDEYSCRIRKDVRLAHFAATTGPGRWRAVGGKETARFFRQHWPRAELCQQNLEQILERSLAKPRISPSRVTSVPSSPADSPRTSSADSTEWSHVEIAESFEADVLQDGM
mmetsp:Transcript_40444/g.72670  ORF Transcript_40444/g.72670 Transcript_40444/m.72670 type:complete len:510 (-) Transcript_40444:315-1844(-)